LGSYCQPSPVGSSRTSSASIGGNGTFAPGIGRKANGVADLDGIWQVERSGGFLPPLLGVRKTIRGPRGRTSVGPLGVPFAVVGNELRYRRPFEGFVDVLEPAPGGWQGRALFRGREYGRFRMTPLKEERMSTIDDQLTKHIDEAIAMEENVKRMLDGMLQTLDDPQLVDLVEHHRAETEEHSLRLRRRLEARGASPSLVREATGILGALAKLPLDVVRGEKAGRHCRDAYATEHLEIASYQLLERVARRAGDEETAEVARLNRADEEAMARKLDELWDQVVEQSLREEGIPSAARD
jgi:ferritin-like metal-binding protein YciE